MIKGFRHIGIVVNDLDKQLVFYRDLLQMEVLYDKVEKGPFLEHILGITDADAKIIKLGYDGATMVELLFFIDKGRPRVKSLLDNGYTHFAITVKDIYKCYRVMSDNNVSFISEPMINEAGTHSVCFCKDFEGNPIELVEELL